VWFEYAALNSEHQFSSDNELTKLWLVSIPYWSVSGKYNAKLCLLPGYWQSCHDLAGISTLLQLLLMNNSISIPFLQLYCNTNGIVIYYSLIYILGPESAKERWVDNVSSYWLSDLSAQNLTYCYRLTLADRVPILKILKFQPFWWLL